jgi:hypothetical protein
MSISSSTNSQSEVRCRVVCIPRIVETEQLVLFNTRTLTVMLITLDVKGSETDSTPLRLTSRGLLRVFMNVATFNLCTIFIKQMMLILHSQVCFSRGESCFTMFFNRNQDAAASESMLHDQKECQKQLIGYWRRR